jgi:hypothetical protein
LEVLLFRLFFGATLAGFDGDDGMRLCREEIDSQEIADSNEETWLDREEPLD